jgi:multidrug efflux system membrane fusion protein
LKALSWFVKMSESKRVRAQMAIACLVAFVVAPDCSKRGVTPPAGAGRGALVPVNVAEIVKKDVPIDLTAIGNVEPIATVGIKAQVGGELIEMNFQEGQEVKKGDLLFTIQPKLYATQLAQAEANLARDRVQAGNAQRDAERSAELAKKGAVSKEQLDQTLAAAEAAAATVKADEALVEIARVQLGYTTVESPIDGRTGATSVKVGNLIKPAADEPMVTINQLAPIYVTFSVPEQYLADIRREMAKRTLGVAANDPQDSHRLGEGELTFVSNTVDAATGTIMLKATFPNDDRALWPGAYVHVVLHLSSEPGVLVAPSPAVTVGQNGEQMFVIKEDGTAELRPVTVERTVGQEVVIQGNFQPGERVVINGQSRLTPGAKVEIKPAAGRAEEPRAAVAAKGNHG